MALFGDIVGDDENAVAQAASEVVRIANTRVGEGFVAVSPEARKKFWLDRARTAAIAKHTNAFKINEDVVIPLNRMGEYTDGIERINIELSIKNKLQLATQLREWFEAGNLPVGKSDDATGESIGAEEMLGDRVRAGLDVLDAAFARWTFILANLDQPLPAVKEQLYTLGLDRLAVVFDARLGTQPDATSVRRGAGPHRARLVEAGDPRADAPDLQRRGLQADPRRDHRPSTSACCVRACSWRCTCTPATATCTPTCRSTPTTTPCCRTRTKPWAAS
jgi:FAD/FMN-containing dehydrogenase